MKSLALIVTALAHAVPATALASAAGVATVQSGRPFAAPDAIGNPAPEGVAGLGDVTLALALVLAAVFAAGWILRRVRGLGNRVGSAIDVLADIPLGQKERAVLIKVGSAQLLLGVAPGRVSTLHVLEQPIEIATPPAQAGNPRPSFKALLMRSLGKS